MNLIESLRARDLSALGAAIAASPKEARSGRAVCEAGRLAWRQGFELLLDAGADLNASYRNYRPLHSLLQEEPHAAACKPTTERLACLEWLLQNGADPEQTGAWPTARAIVIAGFTGFAEYVLMLRQHGAAMDGFAGAATGKRKLLEKLLARDPAFAQARDAGTLTALHCASGTRMPKANRHAMARMLLDAGAEVNATARSWSHDVYAISFAAAVKDRALFNLLIERGANATNALSSAVWSNAYDLADSALAHGAQPDRATSNGRPLLNDLIRWGRFEQFFWLLDRGASPNVSDNAGWTAVHQAASRGNERMLRAVLERGGDKNSRDRNGQTPRDVARSDKIAEILKR